MHDGNIQNEQQKNGDDKSQGDQPPVDQQDQQQPKPEGAQGDQDAGKGSE